MCETCGCGHDHEHIHLMIPVKGINDSADAEKLEAALNQLPGVHATADYKLGAVSLLLHEGGDLTAAENLIQDLGFKI
jgi:hypothetical protein